MPGDFIGALPVNPFIHPAGLPINTSTIKVLRRPVESAQYTSWVFGHRLRAAGLLGSMGRVASSVDNSMIESFFSTLQRELLDTRRWQTRAELASAIFEWMRPGTTPAADTPASATSPRSATHRPHQRRASQQRGPRCDHPTTRVRKTGSGSRGNGD